MKIRSEKGEVFTILPSDEKYLLLADGIGRAGIGYFTWDELIKLFPTGILEGRI